MQKFNVVDMKSAMMPVIEAEFPSLPSYRLTDWETMLIMDAEPSSPYHNFLTNETRNHIKTNVLLYKKWRDSTGFIPNQ